MNSNTNSARSKNKDRLGPFPCMIVVAFPRAGDPVILDTYGPPFSRLVAGVATQWDNVADHEISELGTTSVGKDVDGHDIGEPPELVAPRREDRPVGIHVWTGTVCFHGDPGDEDGEVDAVWEGDWRVTTDIEDTAISNGTWRGLVAQKIAFAEDHPDAAAIPPLAAEWRAAVVRCANTQPVSSLGEPS